MFYCHELSQAPTVQQLQPTFSSAGLTNNPAEKPGSAVVAAYNIGDYFSDAMPHVVETIAANLKLTDYSRFISALKPTTLRPAREIYYHFSLNNFNLACLRPHEQQLYLALWLMEENTHDELDRIITIDTVANSRQPYAPFPLGTLAVGSVIAEYDYRSVNANYLKYVDRHIPEHLLAGNKIARALWQWKKCVINKDDSLRRIFTNGNGFSLNNSNNKYFFFGLQLYKAELNPVNLKILLSIADQQFASSAAPGRYGIALAVIQLIMALKKNKLAGLSELQINETTQLYPRLIADGMEVYALLPGGKYFLKSALVQQGTDRNTMLDRGGKKQ